MKKIKWTERKTIFRIKWKKMADSIKLPKKNNFTTVFLETRDISDFWKKFIILDILDIFESQLIYFSNHIFQYL